MNEIKIIEKPEWISWDDIHQLLLEAHKDNIAKGLVSLYPQLPGEKIKEKLGEEGRCWVALDGDKLVGTHSVTFFKGKKWWNKGKSVAHGCFTGILKEYQGIGILDELHEKYHNYVSGKGIDMTEGDTPESNRIMRKVLEKKGFKTVEFFAPHSDHYSVRIVKWYNGCPFHENYILRRFKISEKLTRWRYKPGKVERSVFMSFFCRAANKIVNIYYGD